MPGQARLVGYGNNRCRFVIWGVPMLEGCSAGIIPFTKYVHWRYCSAIVLSILE
jgi:hypothetical protein